MIKIAPDEIKIISQYVYNISGIALDEKKAYLLETRLSSLAEELGCKSFIELYQKTKSDIGQTVERKIINAMTTNETLFFRDYAPFELFRHKLLPELIDKRAKFSLNMPIPIRVWSAACSTGQEVYSLAIVVKELLHNRSKYNIKLLGTDISDQAIAQASYGQYNKFEIDRGLDRDKLDRYFQSNGNYWKIKDDIRAMAVFKKLNLMQPFQGLGKFDIIFCRNVAIYFTLEDRKKLFNKIADVLEPDGYLVIGSTESLTGICPRFEPLRHLRSIFYQLK